MSLFGAKRVLEVRIPNGKSGVDGARALESLAADPPPDTVTLIDLAAADESISVAETNLPAESQDMILLVDVYHEFSEPQKMARSMHRALKGDGRLVLLEFRKEAVCWETLLFRTL